MAAPRIEIDIARIEANSRAICSLCRDYGIEVSGVSKVSCGMPQIAHAMIRGGVSSIGESRLENIFRLRAGGINRPIMLLRIPPLSRAEEIVRNCDISLNSELEVLRRLNQEAEKAEIRHGVVLMVDLGDLREGILPGDLMPLCDEVLQMPGLKLEGIGTNLTCYGGVLPSQENMQELANLADAIEQRFGFRLNIVSGGNSSALPLLASGGMPKKINHLRIGEAILLGRETAYGKQWPGTDRRCFLLKAELIECKRKPSLPKGETGMDAFGKQRHFKDRGERIRGILNIGREDSDIEALHPADQEVHILGASSDHLLVDLGENESNYRLGDEVAFYPDYSALLTAMTSSYVEKLVMLPPHLKLSHGKRVILMGKPWADESKRQTLEKGLITLGYQLEHLPTEADPDLLAEQIRKHSVAICFGSRGMESPLLPAAQGMNRFSLLWVDSTIAAEELRAVIGESLSPEQILLLGAREFPAESVDLIRRYRICAYTMEEISLLSMREVMRLSLHRLCSGSEGIYLRFAGRVADRGNDGLTNRETHLIMEMLAASGSLRVIELRADEAGESGESHSEISHFILSAMGKRILGNVNQGAVE